MQTRQVRRANNAYIQGNVVRKASPQRRNEQQIKVYINNKKERKTSPIKFMGMCCVLGLIFFFSIQHLKLQSEITKTLHTINATEAEYYELKTENDDEWKRVTTSYDIEEIRNIALNELGMIYPSEGQIVYYDGVNNDYVRQYAAIPVE